MEHKIELAKLPRQFAAGAAPAALFFALLLIAYLMEPYALVPALLALVSLGGLTPSRIIWARSRLSAAVATMLAAALICGGIATDSWATIPLIWVLMAPTAAAQCVLRLFERGEDDRWFDVIVSFIVGMASFVAAVSIITSGTRVLGLLTLAVLGLLAAFRWLVGPPLARA